MSNHNDIFSKTNTHLLTSRIVLVVVRQPCAGGRRGAVAVVAMAAAARVVARVMGRGWLATWEGIAGTAAGERK